MSITPMWRVDRDGTMFADKKSAEAHDKMLELAENFGQLLESRFEMDEKLAENIGLLLSQNKETLLRALKGKPELLLTIDHAENSDEASETPDQPEKRTLAAV
ncbi:hypothetical protein CI610_00737 [invertebrate metagenome]|uniref:YebG protein n=1 Tax=invertebrate metagenome TaxID=1711999 RepID=A0A2H9TAI9_9ZZZZ